MECVEIIFGAKVENRYLCTKEVINFILEQHKLKMGKLRQSFSRALEEFRFAFFSVFAAVIFFTMEALLFREIPELVNHYSFASLREVVVDILLVVSCILILGRRKMGVWLWLATVSLDITLMFIDKGVSGFDKSFIFGIILRLFILVFWLPVKKDGKTAWSVLK